MASNGGINPNTALVVGGIALGGYLLYTLRDQIKGLFSGTGTGVTNAVQGLGSGISDAAVGLGQGIGDVGEGVSKLTNQITDTTQLVPDIKQKILDPLIDFYSGLITPSAESKKQAYLRSLPLVPTVTKSYPNTSAGVVSAIEESAKTPVLVAPPANAFANALKALSDKNNATEKALREPTPTQTVQQAERVVSTSNKSSSVRSVSVSGIGYQDTVKAMGGKAAAAAVRSGKIRI